MIPAVGSGFLSFMVATPPVAVPLPVPHVATYASQGGAAPIVTPLLDGELTERAIGDAEAAAVYGVVETGARITVVSLMRTGVYSALVVDAVELMGGTAACATTPDSTIASCGERPDSDWLACAPPLDSVLVLDEPRPVSGFYIEASGAPPRFLALAQRVPFSGMAALAVGCAIATSARVPVSGVMVLAVQAAELTEDSIVEVTEDGFIQENEDA